MASLPKILVQEEEELAEARKDHDDVLTSIYNNAGKKLNLKIKSKY